METVTSADGTRIACDRTGTGPPLVLVHAAGQFRGFSSFDGLVDLLAPHFTVHHYDRRGRGDSTDTPPYAVEREVEDLAAVIDAAGGSAFVHAFSSGGLVALHAAAGGVEIERMSLLEPPVDAGQDRGADAAHLADLRTLVAAGDRAAVVEFVLAGVGVPGDIVAGMRGTPSWAALESTAHTQVYDAQLSLKTTPEVLAGVTVPVLVVDSEGSADALTGMAAHVAAALPDATHRSLPGQWHSVPDDLLAPVLIEYLRNR
ncbi:MAG: alpha/beta fold hydrolase [Pseudonocardia sp.]